jgi:hypothetical protein
MGSKPKFADKERGTGDTGDVFFRIDSRILSSAAQTFGFLAFALEEFLLGIRNQLRNRNPFLAPTKPSLGKKHAGVFTR